MLIIFNKYFLTSLLTSISNQPSISVAEMILLSFFCTVGQKTYLYRPAGSHQETALGK